MELPELAQKMKDQKTKIDELNFQVKAEKAIMSSLEEDMLEQLSHLGVSRLDMENIGTFYIHTRKFYKIEDKDALFEFISDQNDDDILTVQHQTLNAYVKEKVLQAEERGDEEFAVPGTTYHATNSVRIRKISN
jgi:hypothetical protein